MSGLFARTAIPQTVSPWRPASARPCRRRLARGTPIGKKAVYLVAFHGKGLVHFQGESRYYPPKETS